MDGGGDPLLLILYVALALGVSFLCSIAEAVLLSVTPTHIESIREHKPRRAALLKRLKQDEVDQSLAAILTLNTIAHTVGAIGAGAEATVVFGSAWFGVFSAVMTLLILFLSEIVPKTIGAVYWIHLTGPVAQFVRILIIVLYPLVWVSERITRMIASGRSAHAVGRDDVLAMTRIGERAGSIDGEQSRIINNLFQLTSLRAVDVMTPRTVIYALPLELSIDEAAARVAESAFSRVPVYGEDIDDVRGFVIRDDVLQLKGDGRGEESLLEIQREILTVPGSISLSRMLERLIRERHHIALLVDEYGGTLGLVTLEDVIETLVGAEILDETDGVADMRELARARQLEEPSSDRADS
jgi:CBS domain containing-hemolysin-like protein